VYENFESEETMKTGIIPAPEGGEIGGHAMMIEAARITTSRDARP
jgi:hypothetical protein